MFEYLIIASPKKVRVAYWKQEFQGFVTTAKSYDSMNLLFNDMVQIEPKVLLLDLDLLGSNILNGVANLKLLSPQTRIIILSGVMSEDLELNLLKAGVWGNCGYEIRSELLKQVVMAVNNGQMWRRRMLVEECMH